MAANIVELGRSSGYVQREGGGGRNSGFCLQEASVLNMGVEKSAFLFTTFNPQ